MTTHRSPAGDLAGQRAAECRARLAQLSAGVKIGPEDARRARETLSAARERAVNAQVSAVARQLQFRSSPFAVKAQPRPEALSSPVEPRPAAETLSRMHTGRLSVSRVYDHYWSLGGRCSTIEIDAYLHLEYELPAIERVLLDHAVWELEI
jgi:hypothetical protein